MKSNTPPLVLTLRLAKIIERTRGISKCSIRVVEGGWDVKTKHAQVKVLTVWVRNDEKVKIETALNLLKESV